MEAKKKSQVIGDKSHILLGIGDVAKALEVTKTAVRSFIERKKLKATKTEVYPKVSSLPDYVWTVTLEDLEQFMLNRSKVRRGKKAKNTESGE